MIIDGRDRTHGKNGRDRSNRAKRTEVISTKTGESLNPAPKAIDTMAQKLTFRVPKKERLDLFQEYREERYEAGEYILRDNVTGLEWPAENVTIPCLQRDGLETVECPCLDCFPD